MLKLDRAFVRDITEDPRDAAIARAVIAMSHDMSLRVIAEGVENEGQLNYLFQQGCDELQGYYFSPPLPAPDMARMLRAGRCLSRNGKSTQGALLVVDDDAPSCRVLAEVLGRDGYQVLIANSGQEALRILALQDVLMVITDQRMPGMPGTDLLSRVRQLYPGVLRILTSAHDDLEVVVDAINRVAVSKFIPKPWNVEVVRGLVRQAFAAHAEAGGRGGAAG
jgi:CheY-like chemotaxis protein